MAPLPNIFSICPTALSSITSFSLAAFVAGSFFVAFAIYPSFENQSVLPSGRP
jgi:hypothetical protein